MGEIKQKEKRGGEKEKKKCKHLVMLRTKNIPESIWN